MEFCMEIADHTKAKTLLGFEDQTNLEQMIEEMYLYAISLPKQEVEYMPYEIDKNMYSFWKK